MSSKKAPSGTQRRLLLLTDGHLNCGIVEPVQVERIVASGLEKDTVRTSCLGFGDNYSEDILRQLAKASGGRFPRCRLAREVARDFQGRT